MPSNFQFGVQARGNEAHIHCLRLIQHLKTLKHLVCVVPSECGLGHQPSNSPEDCWFVAVSIRGCSRDNHLVRWAKAELNTSPAPRPKTSEVFCHFWWSWDLSLQHILSGCEMVLTQGVTTVVFYVSWLRSRVGMLTIQQLFRCQSSSSLKGNDEQVTGLISTIKNVIVDVKRTT